MIYSVSKVLNMYFDPIDIALPAIQRGIFRGVAIDVAIENFFKTKKLNLPPKERVLKNIINDEVKKEVDELYRQSKKCLNGFERLKTKNQLYILEVQKWVTSDNLELKGYIDALISLNNKKFVVDWKSKNKFKEYNKTDFQQEYIEYKKWCSENGYNYSNYDAFARKKINTNRLYWLSHLRYCLQVCFYWMLLGEPNDYECLIAYFDTDEKYNLYTFNKEKVKKICLTMLKFKDSSDTQKKEINLKLKSLKINLEKYIEWKKVNY